MQKFFQEGLHPAHFILWEEERAYSRDNIVVGENQDVQPGQIIISAAGGYVAGDYGAAPAGNAVFALPIYAVKTGAGETAHVAAIVRQAEVINGQVYWPAGTTDANKAAWNAALARQGILVR
jgi:Bacteriophage lambda head decoration protein D